MITYKKNKNSNLKRGMTYVELIVVLSIFTVMSSIVLYNYKGFQAKIDMKNLTNDIALKIKEAQNAAVAGKLSTLTSDINWKPAYGVYFDSAVANNKRFIYFADVNTMNDNTFQGTNCTIECLSNITITKGNSISALSASGTGTCSGITTLSVAFTRPDLKAVMKTSQPTCVPKYAEITVSSPTTSATAKIKIYESGRIQIN